MYLGYGNALAGDSSKMIYNDFRLFGFIPGSRFFLLIWQAVAIACYLLRFLQRLRLRALDRKIAMEAEIKLFLN